MFCFLWWETEEKSKTWRVFIRFSFRSWGKKASNDVSCPFDPSPLKQKKLLFILCAFSLFRTVFVEDFGFGSEFPILKMCIKQKVRLFSRHYTDYMNEMNIIIILFVCVIDWFIIDWFCKNENNIFLNILRLGKWKSAPATLHFLHCSINIVLILFIDCYII